MRFVAALLLALLLAAPAWANNFDSFIENHSPNNYWPMTTNGHDVVGSANMGVTGTGTYGQTLGALVSGYTPGSSSSYLTQTGFAFVNWQCVPSVCAIIETGPSALTLWFNTTGSGRQVFMSPASNVALATSLEINGPDCSTGQVELFLYGTSSGNLAVCSANTYNDGNPHQAFVLCSFAYPFTFTCSLQMDGGSDVSSASPFFVDTNSIGVVEQFGNQSSGPYPVTGSVGGIAYWQAQNGTVPTNQWAKQAYTCGATGYCELATNYYPLTTLPATNYWPLGLSGIDVIGGNDAATTGTITYNQTITLNGFIGMEPATNSSLLSATQAWTSSTGWGVGLAIKSSSSAAQVLMAVPAIPDNTWYFDLNDSSNCGTGYAEFAMIDSGGSAHYACSLSSTVNDGNGHFLYADCNNASGSVTCAFYVDGIQSSIITATYGSFGGSVTMDFGNWATSHAPVSGALGSIVYYGGANKPDSNEIYTLSSCINGGLCSGLTPPLTCSFTRPGMTLQWCDTMQYHCTQGTNAWWQGPIGPQTTATGPSFISAVAQGVGSGTITGTTLTIASMTSGAFAAGDTITGSGVTSNTTIIAQLTGGGTGQTGTYSLSASSSIGSPTPITTPQPIGTTLYDNNTCSVAGNNNVSNSSQIQSGLVATNWQIVTPVQNIASETLWPGWWQPTATFQNNLPLYNNGVKIPYTMTVGQGGGAVGAAGYTARYFPNPLVQGAEITLMFWGNFTAANLVGEPLPQFGFGSSGCTPSPPAPCQSVANVKYGDSHSPPAGYVNFEVDLNDIGSIGNISCPAGWSVIVLDVKRSTTSNGSVYFQGPCGAPITYSGITDYGSIGTNDQVYFAGELSSGDPLQEAAFNNIAVFTGRYTPPYYPPPGGNQVIWFP